MKKILLWVCLCAALPAAGLEYGVMADYVPAGAEAAGAGYLLRPVLEGRALRVALSVEQAQPEELDQYSAFVQASYQAWFDNAAKHIRRAGREAEFADILPLLARGVRIEQVAEGEPADLKVFFVQKLKPIRDLCGPLAIGCYVPQEKALWSLKRTPFWMTLLSAGRQSRRTVTQHEVGHSLGFSDQYRQARSQNTDALYHSNESKATVMNNTHGLSCDDADGLVNLIDLTRGTVRGGERGWKSLCPKSEDYYVRGMLASAGPYRIHSDDALLHWTVEEFRQGQRVAQWTQALDLQGRVSLFIGVPDERVLEQDALGRPVRAEGPAGEHIYYAYVYDKTTRLVEQDGAVLLVQLRTTLYTPLKTAVRTETFGVGGQLGVLYGKQSRHQREVWYEESQGGQINRRVVLSFNRRGVMKDAQWLEQAPVLYRGGAAALSLPGMTRALQDTVADQVLQGQLKEWLFSWEK